MGRCRRGGSQRERGSCYPAEKPGDFTFPISKSTHCNVSPQTGSPEQTGLVWPHIGGRSFSNHEEEVGGGGDLFARDGEGTRDSV